MPSISHLLRRLVSLLTSCALITAVVFIPIGSQATTDPTLIGGTAVSGVINVATPISDLQVSGTGNPSVPVRLFVSHGSLAMSTTTGLSFTTATSGANLAFTGTISSVNTALATLTYTRSSLGTDTLEATLVGAGEIYFPGTQDVYEVVSSTQTWTNARTAAAARTKYGLSGYLATITSDAENTFISDRLTSAGWMGASDSATEGDWKWVVGPETGTSFWSGSIAGHTVGGQYANWNSGEPNDSGSNEDCAQFLAGGSGMWNDLPCSGTTLPAYVVEYGAPGNRPQVASKNVSITTVAGVDNIATCAALQTLGANNAKKSDAINLTTDIDCTGVDFIPLFTGDSYHGAFDGHSHTISNLTINHPGDQYQGLFATLASGASVSNLILASGAIHGDEYVGGIAGVAYAATLTNVISKLTLVSTDSYVGGLVGYYGMSNTDPAASLSNVSTAGTISGISAVGGLIGMNQMAAGGTLVMEKCFTTGNVTATSGMAGGLIGENDMYSDTSDISTTIRNCYTHGDISSGSTAIAGGLIGYTDNYSDGSGPQVTLAIEKTYSSGAISGSADVGGLIGISDEMPNAQSIFTLSDSFAVGHIAAGVNPAQGALVGDNKVDDHGIVSTGNYYDKTGTGQTVCAGLHDLTSCVAENTTGTDSSYFINNHSNAPMSAWDFSTIWFTNVGIYPIFEAIPVVPTPTPSATPSPTATPAATVIENAGPNNGDANGDGTADSAQDNVTSFSDAVSGGYVAVEINSACTLSGVTAADESTKPVQDIGFNYPAGLVSFTSVCGTSGYTAIISQYFYGITATSLVGRKYHSHNESFAAIPGAVISEVTIGGQKVTKLTYQITDGGALDEDGVANGTIIDPAGIATSVVGAPKTGVH